MFRPREVEATRSTESAEMLAYAHTCAIASSVKAALFDLATNETQVGGFSGWIIDAKNEGRFARKDLSRLVPPSERAVINFSIKWRCTKLDLTTPPGEI